METSSAAGELQQQQQQENLLLSFENPNYQLEKQFKSMDQARIDDHLNSNIEPNVMYEELCRELKIYTDLSGEGMENMKQNNSRWTYGQLNTATMIGTPMAKDEEKEVSCEKKNDLAEGWEMHEDEGGLYFWHVKSGTIQREIPKAFKMSKSSTMSKLPSQASHEEQKRKSLPPAATSPVFTDDPNAGMQVRVRTLGSIQLNEESLTNENSSKAVNRCIVQLSSGSNLDGPECKELILSLTEGTLQLTDPGTGAVVSSQPIHTIRVWGVGRDDSRDFAYVARDKATRCHTCHVFRCDAPARAIANKLRDICKKILIERSLTSSSARAQAEQTSRASSVEEQPPPAPMVPNASSSGMIRPTHFTSKLKTKTVRAPESFPTPMEEPKKIIKARFIGEVEVTRPGGMDTINQAIELSESKCAEPEWALVNVGVAPSTITITFSDSRRSPIDCRVRFLSFLGIGQDPRKCAFIVHTAQDTFQAYTFHCEPTSGPLCKTIEAACTLRYQKCLDARPQRLQSPSPSMEGRKGGEQPAKQASTTIKKALKTIFFGGNT